MRLEINADKYIAKRFPTRHVYIMQTKSHMPRRLIVISYVKMISVDVDYNSKKCAHCTVCRDKIALSLKYFRTSSSSQAYLKITVVLELMFLN